MSQLLKPTEPGQTGSGIWKLESAWHNVYSVSQVKEQYRDDTNRTIMNGLDDVTVLIFKGMKCLGVKNLTHSIYTANIDLMNKNNLNYFTKFYKSLIFIFTYKTWKDIKF